jgi:hypothetical protein
MDIDELIFIIYQLVNEYIEENITIDEEPWIQSDILRIINHNLAINFNSLIFFLAKSIDKIIYNRIKQDANVVTVLKYKDRFQLRLLARKINSKIIKKVKIN